MERIVAAARDTVGTILGITAALLVFAVFIAALSLPFLIFGDAGAVTIGVVLLAIFVVGALGSIVTTRFRA